MIFGMDNFKNFDTLSSVSLGRLCKLKWSHIGMRSLGFVQ